MRLLVEILMVGALIHFGWNMPFKEYVAQAGPSTSLADTNSTGMFGNRSEWTRAERFRAVLEGRRHLGQQVIEALFVSNEPFSAAEAESYLRDVIHNVAVLRQLGNR